MKNKRLLIGSISFILLGFIGLIGYLITYVEPKITIRAEIGPITDEDYIRINERSDRFIKTATKDDFKRIHIEMKYSEPLALISNRKIEFNHLLTSATITKSGVVNLSGGRSERDNPNESIADYMENAEIYLNGMSINELKSLFNDYVIKVSWDKLGIGRVERIVHLNDFIEIK